MAEGLTLRTGDHVILHHPMVLEVGTVEAVQDDGVLVRIGHRRLLVGTEFLSRYRTHAEAVTDWRAMRKAIDQDR